METDTRIFLNYARKDMGDVREIYEFLKGYGFSPWMDVFDLKAGQDWLEMLIQTIHEVPIFIACLSNHSVTQRGIVTRELNEALDVAKERIFTGDDVFILPIRLEEVDPNKIPRKLNKFNWVDWFTDYGRKKLIQDLRNALRQLGINNPLNLRSQPLENLTQAEVGELIRERNFYDQYTWPGAGIHHEYEPQIKNGDKVIIDHTASLMWQQSGSSDCVNYKAAEEYIAELNNKRFASFDNWRLPTVEEAMSLMEPQIDDKLYINPLFGAERKWIWTADRHSDSSVFHAWVVSFYVGRCARHRIEFDDGAVRAVRSEKSI